MKEINRQDIHLINKYSNLNEEELNNALNSYIYSSPGAWKLFIKWFLLSIGAGFGVAGIIFFFAYNWNEIHKFVKLSIIQCLIIIPTGLVLFSKLNTTVKNIILTAASVLVGVLFAVFGQIYQTGANAYDFFLGWTLSIALWVVVTGFAPLWLVFIILINTTLNLYYEQVVQHWRETEIATIQFIINTTFFLGTIAIQKLKGTKAMPVWFSGLVTIITFYFLTVGICLSIFSESQLIMITLILVSVLVYSIAAYTSLKEKSIFNLSLIAISLIIICTAMLINISNDAGMLLVITLFVVVAITLTVKLLIDLNKKWINEK